MDQFRSIAFSSTDSVEKKGYLAKLSYILSIEIIE
jgi:hypothetical protein